MPNEDRSGSPVWTILNTLQWTTDFFSTHGIENPRSDAEVLLAHALACERIDLYLNHDQPLQAEELSRFKKLIQRRCRREPVAYIRGIKEFWSLEFIVTPDVLIPRPETEGLVEAALRHCCERDSIDVLELGTGSGIISVSLAHERPRWRFWALDISEKAITIARLNARKHASADRIAFMVGHWFEAIGGHKKSFDLIVSNPPYIARDVLPTLEPDVHDYEPSQSLNGGPEGLDCIAHIINTASGYMKPGGRLLIEIGYDQGEAAQELGRACGAYDHINVDKDFSGHDRLVRLRKK